MAKIIIASKHETSVKKLYRMCRMQIKICHEVFYLVIIFVARSRQPRGALSGETRMVTSYDLWTLTQLWSQCCGDTITIDRTGFSFQLCAHIQKRHCSGTRWKRHMQTLKYYYDALSALLASRKRRPSVADTAFLSPHAKICM